MTRDRGVRNRNRGARRPAGGGLLPEELRRRTQARRDHIFAEVRRRILAHGGLIAAETRRKVQVRHGLVTEEMRRRFDVELRTSRAQLRYDPATRAANRRVNQDAIDSGAELAINERQLTAWAQRDTVLGNGQDILSFHFLEQFAVADLHVQELLRGPMAHGKLEDFQAGSLSQGSFHITDRMLTSLAQTCPNLKQVRLLGACQLTDRALAALVEFCRRIEYIEISGSEQESGKIIAPSHIHRLKNLSNRWGYFLCKMVLCNQANLDLESCEKLTEVHCGLELIVGNTASNDLNLMSGGQVTKLVRTEQQPGEDGHQRENIEDLISRGLGGMTIDDAGDIVME